MLQWYGHVLRREDEYVGKRVMVMEVPGKRIRGRPKRMCLDNIKNDLSERELSGEETQDRVKWWCLTRIVRGGSARPSEMVVSHKNCPERKRKTEWNGGVSQELSGEEAQDRVKWWCLTRIVRGGSAIPSEMVVSHKNCPGRKRKTEWNGGVSQELSGEEAQDRVKWWCLTRIVRGGSARPSEMVVSHKNCPGRKRKTEWNGGVSQEISTQHNSGKGCRKEDIVKWIWL